MSGIKQKKETNKTLLALTGLLLVLVSISSGCIGGKGDGGDAASDVTGVGGGEDTETAGSVSDGVDVGADIGDQPTQTGIQTGQNIEQKQQSQSKLKVITTTGAMVITTGASMVIKNLQNDTDVTATVANTGATSLSTFTMYIGTNSAQNTTVTIAEGGTGTMQFENMGTYITTGVTKIKIVASEGAIATYQYVA